MPEPVPATEQPAPDVTGAAAVEPAAVEPVVEPAAEAAAAPAAAAVAAPTAAETAAAEQATADAAQAVTDTAIDAAKAAQAKDIAKLLGLPGFEEDVVDPAKLAETLQAERDTIAAERDTDRNKLREYELRDHVRTNADKKADVAGLYDSASFLADIKGIDPSDAKAATLIADAIDAAVLRRPSLGLADPASTASSSAESSGDGKPAPAADSVDAFRAQAKSERGDSRF